MKGPGAAGSPDSSPQLPSRRPSFLVPSTRKLTFALLLVLAAAALAVAYVVDTRAYEERLALVHCRHVAEIESVLGPPQQVYLRHGEVHPSHAAEIYSKEDERSGLVLHRYNLWFVGLGFHVGYKTLLAKVRSSDGAVIAARVHYE